MLYPRKAYTLMEMVLVLAVIGIMGAVAYPTVMDMYGSYRLRAAADSVRAGWVGARSHAVEEGQRYRFSVIPGKGNFRIAPDDPSYWGGALPQSDPSHPPLVLEDALPSGIRFTVNGAPASDDGDSSEPVGHVNDGDWVTQAYFDADGTAPEDVTITLASPGSRGVVVSLRSLTCTTTVKLAPLEGSR